MMNEETKLEEDARLYEEYIHTFESAGIDKYFSQSRKRWLSLQDYNTIIQALICFTRLELWTIEQGSFTFLDCNLVIL